MKKILLYFFLLSFLVPNFSFTQEYPVTSTPSIVFHYDPSIFDHDYKDFISSNLPVWSVLDRMSMQDRNNSLIDIEYSNNEFSESLDQIASLWNIGEYSESIEHFKLINSDKLRDVSIAINWKVPVPTTNSETWGSDVRIGNRDSITAVSLTYEKSTGKLFAILVLKETSTYYYTVNMSTNNGNTWAETFAYSGGSSQIVSTSSAVVDSFCYVGYAYEGSQNTGRLRRFSTSTGASATFIDGASFKDVITLAATDSVEEISITTNQTEFNNMLYYSVITKSDSLIGARNNEATVVYIRYLNAFTDAKAGLDLTWNKGYSSASNTFYCFGSYVNTANGVTVFGIANDSLQLLSTLFNGFVNSYSSVSAYKDTITGVFQFGGGGNKSQNRYFVSYNGGNQFLYGLVGDSSLTSEAPDVAAGDGGVGIIYRYYTSPREGRFVWRPLSGAWSTAEKYTDNEPYYNKPSIEYLGNNKFGVVYLSWTSPVVRGAYFDLNDMLVGIDDFNVDLPSDYNLLQNYPNPFNPSTVIRFSVPEQANVTLKIFNSIGQEIATLLNGEITAGNHQVDFNATALSSGIYFYQISSPSFTATKKMILIK